MCRWLCCSCLVEESSQPYENDHDTNGNQRNSKVAAPAETEVQKSAPPPIEVPALSLEELKEKTDNFGSKALIGEDVEFLTQVSMVSRMKHDNFVKLQGYCVEGNHRVLAYEFATLGSLHDVLHGKKGVQGAQPGPVLDWMQRSPDMAARLHSTRVLGTFGYHAPEYAMTGQLTQKSDVYSFGVVLLELLTGRKPVDHTMPRGQQSLVTWATPRLSEDKVEQCVDPKLKGEYPPKGVAKLAAVASLCVQYEAEFRPSMSIVVMALQPLLKAPAPAPEPES
ncbi:hypothetical protein V6N11_029714 [Hibiscus sabdariffa]|uniref:Protein kinase domain-containing protein n=1 Tax=Hibiscus sabdariffa TaxID=183260 RepID=A0ABR2P7H4_9ROSI